ncbi:membrane metalloprotease ARASP, chloroplastic-like [Juglans regia]|uniref:Membrane metalloprotease ARASP, chloroplastic-like n=1 Tax=Juglans regia TaxID=51240 RepID=A0A6P9EPW4_JUGRE|nr:membrane metalloprotease ARASP, chloroplastic-like [Juglans regia]
MGCWEGRKGEEEKESGRRNRITGKKGEDGWRKDFSRNPLGKIPDFRSWAISGLDVGDFENAQFVLESAAVLSAIIIVHESGHFLAAYLQGIHLSKFPVGFGPILAKFNANNVEYSIRAFPLGGFVGFPDNGPESGIPVKDENLLKNRPVFDRVIVISAGVVANIIFAYVIIFIQVFSFGLPVREAFPGVLVTPRTQKGQRITTCHLQT